MMCAGEVEAGAKAPAVAKYDLPDGWFCEQHAFDPDVTHVVWPDHGAVSVHFKRRTIATGWTIPGPAPRNAVLRTGRGWKAALVHEAVGLLQSAWKRSES